MTDAAEELRIIAKDAVLAAYDREAIRRAADELDNTERMLIATQRALIESQAQRIAMTELTIEAKRRTFGHSGTVSYQILPVTNVRWL